MFDKENISLEKEGRRGAMENFIGAIETVGNKLPHPFWLFITLSFIVLLLSYAASKVGLSATYMAAKAGEAPKETTITVLNLLSFPEMREFLKGFVRNYITFPPLGLVVVMMLGVGLIEQTGFISTLIKRAVTSAPPYVATAVLAFVGINANLASDAGLLFTPTIGAAVFKALGRNPWIGIVVGYAAASGGISANIFIAGLDVTLAGITESAAKAMDVPGAVNPLMNWYFMIAATVVLTAVITFVAEKFLVKIIGDESHLESSDASVSYEVTPQEIKGLKWAGVATILFITTMLVLTLPEKAFFRNANGGFLPSSPLLSSIIPILFALFFFVGIVYGLGAGTIKKAKDIPFMMQKQISGLSSFFVTVLPASAFIYFFNKSRLTTVLAVKGADWLKNANLGGIPLLIMLVVMCALLNLLMGSSSAKWLILAPIFVPMFSMVGFSPAMTQIAYRIGDGSSNIISPIAGAVPLIIALFEQYKPKDSNRKVGVGTIIALELPFTITLIVIQIMMLIAWYIFQLPFGPGAY